jgi:hypothetical protein
LAQKQPSFKESVTAHWSIWEFGAENETRLKLFTEDADRARSTRQLPILNLKFEINLKYLNFKFTNVFEFCDL